MKTGRTLVELAQEIDRQQREKRDFIADTRKMRVTPDLRLEFGDGAQAFGINEVAHDQIGKVVGIPSQYYDRMRTEAPDLLATNIDRWFEKYPSKQMVRTLGPTARAFLSDRYRPLDNADLLEAA